MLEKYAERFRQIGKTVDSIRKDAYDGQIKDLSARDIPVLFNPQDFQSDLAMIKNPDPFDVFSVDPEDQERRDNLLAYYAAVYDAFEGRDFEQKSYIKKVETTE